MKQTSLSYNSSPLFKGGGIVGKKPSFLLGVAQLVDFMNVLSKDYVRTLDREDIDILSIASDWDTVGRDLKVSIDLYEQEEKEKAAKQRTLAFA
ncbi:MAG TPA: hypothetical protein VGA53_04420 [Candidatus Paceibacterota bacterium]